MVGNSPLATLSGQTGPYTLRNLTPHEVVLELGDGRRLRFPAAGVVPRLLLGEGSVETLRVIDPEHSGAAQADASTTQASTNTSQGCVDIPVAVGTQMVGLEPPLPPASPGTLLITSRVVAEHCPDRDDLVWPDDLLRDDDGQVVAARRLARRAPTRVPGQPEGSHTSREHERLEEEDKA